MHKRGNGGGRKRGNGFFSVLSLHEHFRSVSAPQVMPDLATSMPGQADTENGKYLLKEAWQQKLADLTSADGRPARRAPAKQGRNPNQHMLVSIDHALLITCQRSLVDFVPARAPSALEPGFVRFFAQDGPVECLREAELVGGTRACICKADGTERKFEVPRLMRNDKVVPAPILHINPDQGPVGWPTYVFMLERMHIRGSITPDPFHINWNSIRAAVLDVSCWLLVLELTVVANAKRGPWMKNGNLRQLQEAADEYFKVNSEDDQVFQMMYPMVAKDWGEVGPTFGTDDHRKSVWVRLRDSPFLGSTGHRVKLMRWFSWMGSMTETKHGILPNWHSFLFYLFILGTHKGWWRTVGDLFGEAPDTLPDEAPQPAQEPSLAVGDPALSKRETMSRSKEEVNLKRKGAQNTLHFCAQVLAKSGNREKVAILTEMTDIEKHMHNSHITLCKTQLGRLEFNMQMATKRWLKPLADTARKVHDPSALRRMGISFGDEVVVGFYGEPETQTQLVRLIFDFALAVIKRRLNALMMYSAPPFCMVSLLHSEVGVRKGQLRRLQDMWSTLEASERRASDGQESIRLWLSALRWPASTWVREMMLHLAEFNFEHIPVSGVAKPLEDFARGFSTTKVVEDAVNILRDADDSGKAGTTGKKELWSYLVQSSLLEENDYPTVRPSDTAVMTAKFVDLSTVFTPDMGKTGISEEIMLELGNLSWNAGTAASWRNQGMVTEAFLNCKGDAKALHESWKSLLMVAGNLAIHRDAQSVAWVVLDSSSYAVVLWRLWPMKPRMGLSSCDSGLRSFLGHRKPMRRIVWYGGAAPTSTQKHALHCAGPLWFASGASACTLPGGGGRLPVLLLVDVVTDGGRLLEGATDFGLQGTGGAEAVMASVAVASVTSRTLGLCSHARSRMCIGVASRRVRPCRVFAVAPGCGTGARVHRAIGLSGNLHFRFRALVW